MPASSAHRSDGRNAGELTTQIDRVLAPDLPRALLQLREGRPSVSVVVDSAPSTHWHERSSVVRPMDLWRRLFALAGFRIADEETLPEPDARSGSWSPRSHWRRLSPFRDEDDLAPRRFRLRRTALPLAVDHAEQAMFRTLGTHLPAVPDPAAHATHVVFLVGTYQEFRQYIPLWTQLPPRAFSVLVRIGARADAGVERRCACMLSWLNARSIDATPVRSVDDVDWSRWRHTRRVLVTGAESTAYDVHLWNASFVIAAQRQSFLTVQLQHGLWPYEDLRRPMVMLSDMMLTWSSEFQKGLEESTRWPDGTEAPRGVVGGMRFRQAGCPLFDAYADTTPLALSDLLGTWTSAYSRSVLVATNLHWSQHMHGSSVNGAIAALATTMPDTLFVVKPHPIHDINEGFLLTCPRNVVVLDEYVCLFSDLDSTRLVKACDAVIATQSTVVLEAALAGRPCVTIDTGNPNRYAHVTLTAPESIGARLDEVLAHPADASAFRAHYFDVALVGSATRRVIEVLKDAPRGERGAEDTRHPVALDRFSSRLSSMAADLEEHQVRLRDLTRDHEAIRAQLARAKAQLDAVLGNSVHTDTTDRAAAHVSTLTAIAAAHDAWLLQPKHGRRVRVALWGASAAGRHYLALIRTIPHLEPLLFVDADAGKWGRSVDGLPVQRPDAAAFARADAIVISSIHAASISKQAFASGLGDRLVFDIRALDALAGHSSSSEMPATA